MRKALIAGGGIAGSVTAIALRKAGIDAVIYEAHPPASHDIGSYLTVSTNGLDALRAVDADDTVITTGFPTADSILLSDTGKRLGRLSNGGRMPDGTVAHTVKRAALYRALQHKAAGLGVGIQYGKRLAGARSTRDGVVAEFTDGSTAVGDLLVGGDGVHSTTRALIDPHAPSGRYVGLVNFGGYSRDCVPPGDDGAWYFVFGRRAFFGYVKDPGGGSIWFSNVPREPVTEQERASTSTQEWKRQLVELFADDHGPAQELISGGELELIGDNTHDLPTVPTWHGDRMVIIGDAAHAPSPAAGQGASMAAEDGVVLAKCLRDHGDIPEALAVFERLRRGRAERIVKHGARNSGYKAPGPIARAMRNLMLPLVFRFLVTEKSLAWIYDHHIDWDTRV